MMLEYDWGNASTIMLSADEQTQDPDHDPTRPCSIFDPTHHSLGDHRQLLSPTVLSPFTNQQYGLYAQTQSQFQHSLYDPPRACYAGDHGTALLSVDQTGTGAYLVVPKSEEFTSSRIGLNLGGRTYFSAADDDFVSRLYRRSRGGESCMSSTPRCQAEGCNADLSHAKHYHRRHKVCEFHSKASTVLAAGLTQRFCQQCSRFHLLSEFDNGKRSCRKRLADHNRRRRKSHQSSSAHDSSKPPPEITAARSPNDSATQSSSSLTVPLSPPTISLDCFRQRQYQATASSSSASSSSNSMFFSTG